MSSTVYETLTQSSNYAAYLSKAITVARSQVLSDMEKEIVDNIGSFRRYAYEADWGSTFPACWRQIPAMVLATGGAVVPFVYGRCRKNVWPVIESVPIKKKEYRNPGSNLETGLFVS